MNIEELLEFNTMLLIERKCQEHNDFFNYVDKHCDVDNKFNTRYKELLDKFLNNYALDKAEKSE